MAMRTLVQSPLALGRALRDARRRRRLTQQQLAELAGVTQATVSNVERGVSRVSLTTLLRILAALKLELTVQSRESESLATAWQDDL
jgi:HTH-type transcriptional regulator/antitoxin HipB